MKKCIIILLDGLGDRAYSSLGNMTPLQAASTPFLDSIAEKGSNGLYHASCFGEPLPSEIAHFLMFGYDRQDFPGRGAVEALGAGIEIGLNDVAILARFVSVYEDKGFLKLGCLRPEFSEYEQRLITGIAEDFSYNGIPARYHTVKGISGVLLLKGDVSAAVTDTDPMIEGNFLPSIRPLEDSEWDAGNTAEAILEYQKHIFRSLDGMDFNAEREKKGLEKINFLVTQRAGKLRQPEPFKERYGMRAISVSSGIVYRGLASYLGMESIMMNSSGTGDDLLPKLELAESLMGEFDFMHIHTKAPDEAAHKKDPMLKKSVIESLDSELAEGLGPFLKSDEWLVIVTADHSTPSGGPLIHSGEPVPMIFNGQGIRRDTVNKFDEVSAACGALGCMRGRELMHMILNSTDRARLGGINETGRECYFWPGKYTPYKSF